jgi:hypothetical protein
MISGYLGSNSDFDAAMEKFALAYGEQAKRDHAALKRAVRAGIIDGGVAQASVAGVSPLPAHRGTLRVPHPVEPGYPPFWPSHG